MDIREYRAAGGVVLDGVGRVLLIERWVVRNGGFTFEIRLPKGHVEPGETDEQAALRETCEETGYCALEVIDDLGEYLNEFILPGERVVRHEHYYLMRLTDPDPGAPHFDGGNPAEACFAPRWAASLPDAEALITFESEREFIRRAALAARNGKQTAAPASSSQQSGSSNQP